MNFLRSLSPSVSEFNFGEYIGIIGCVVVIATILIVEALKKYFKNKAVCPYVSGAVSCVLMIVYAIVCKFPFWNYLGRGFICGCIAIVCYDYIVAFFLKIYWKKIGKTLKDAINKLVHKIIGK